MEDGISFGLNLKHDAVQSKADLFLTAGGTARAAGRRADLPLHGGSRRRCVEGGVAAQLQLPGILLAGGLGVLGWSLCAQSRD